MRVSTLLVLGVLIVGGPFIAHNAGVWRNDLHREKAHVTAALDARLESETAKLATEQLKALERQAANDRRRRRKQLVREKARSAAALKRRAELEARRLTVPAPVTTADAPPVTTTTPVTTTDAPPVTTTPVTTTDAP